MIFGIVCLIISVIALIICMINGRAADPCLAVPMFFTFLITLIAGILSIAFDSAIVGVIVIIVIASWLCNEFWP